MDTKAPTSSYYTARDNEFTGRLYQRCRRNEALQESVPAQKDLLQCGGLNKGIKQIEALVKTGSDIIPQSFYPPVKKHRGKSRDLPMVDESLREALISYIEHRLSNGKKLTPSSPLFITQKGGAYSPNTLQEHMALILQD